MESGKEREKRKELPRSGLAQKNACGAGGWNAPSGAFPALARRSGVVFKLFIFIYFQTALHNTIVLCCRVREI
jgi:hypothetical protein